MLDYKKNTRTHLVPKFILACVASLFLLLIAVLIMRAAWNMYGKFATASAAAEASRAELALLESQKASVEEAIDHLSSSRGVEESLRERFGVAKPGEGEIRIVRDSGTEDEVLQDNDQNFFMRIFNALFVW